MIFIVNIEGFAGEKLLRKENGKVTVDSIDEFKLALKPSLALFLYGKNGKDQGLPKIHFNIPLNTASERTEFLRISTQLVRENGSIKSKNIYNEDGFESVKNILHLYFPDAFVYHV